jgi:ATP-dependent RNA helicase DeaD
MTDGVWFTLSLGRKHRADPKWLLPMICKAGAVTKADVGSIKIDDLETRFEIAADKAEAFAAHLAHSRSLEKGVTIKPATGGALGPAGFKPKPKPRHKEPYDPARADKAAHKNAPGRGPKRPAKPKPARS